MKLRLLCFAGIIFIFNGCKKDGKGCWRAFDPRYYAVTGIVVCKQTKTEAEAAYPQYWFYKDGEREYCWQVEIGSSTSYAWGIPASMAQRQMQENGAYHFTKIDCNSFCTLRWFEKHKSKVTNQFGPTLAISEVILSSDSCSKLSVGRIVIMLETSDSLITREVDEKHP